MMGTKSRTFSLLLAFVFLLLSFSQCLAHHCQCQCDMSSRKKSGDSNSGSQYSDTGATSGSFHSGISGSSSSNKGSGSSFGISGSGSSNTGSGAGISGSGSSHTGSSAGVSGSGSSNIGSHSGISGSGSSNIGSGAGISGSGSSNTGFGTGISGSGSSNIGSHSDISGSGSSNTGSGAGISGSGSSNTGSGSGSSNTGSGAAISGFGSSNTGSGASNSGSGSSNTGSGASKSGSGSSNTGSGASNSGSGSSNTGSGAGISGSGSSNTGSGASNSGSGSSNTGSGAGISGSGSSNKGSHSGISGSGSLNTGSGAGISGSGFSKTGSDIGIARRGFASFGGSWSSGSSRSGSSNAGSSGSYNSGTGSFSSQSSISWSASQYNSSFSNIIAFGDSFTDTGNAGLLGGLKGFANALQPGSPYGKSLSTQTMKPRFCDGRILVDFLSDTLRLPHLAPYQNNSANFSKGVNFAVAGSTVYPGKYFQNNKPGSFMWKDVPECTRIQLDWFQQFLNNSRCKGLGTDQCKLKLSKSLFWVGELGFNDYCPKFGVTSSVQSIMEKLIDFKITLMKTLLDKGAKYMIVQGLPPMGCFPLHMTVGSSGEKDEHGCARSTNSIVKAHNDLLVKKLDEIRSQFPNCSIVYADFWNAFLTILKNPTQHGFSETFKACCGSTGPYNFNTKCLCGSPGSTTCQNPSKFMSWDGLHPTEALYGKMAQLLFHQDFCQPTFKQMISSVGKA